MTRCTGASIALGLVFFSTTAFAQPSEPPTNAASAPAGGAATNAARLDPAASAPASSAPTSRSSAMAAERSPGIDGRAADRSYLLPAAEIIGFQFLLNRANRAFGTDRDDYKVTLDSIRTNLRSSWGTDRDPFKTNQLGHPYQGAIYHGFARSAGFDYWESLGYSFAGSVVWEIAGERTRPSRNDQVASGIGGTFLGEALYRMSNLVLEQGGGLPRVWREVAAAAIAPSAGFNRLVFGDRSAGIFSSRDAAYYSRLQVGVARNVERDFGRSTTDFKRNEAQANFSIDYGLPGQRGYEYTRPFDYFNFEISASTANGFESVLTRGLLVGRSYEAGPNYRGVWGLYGSYSYIAPQPFRVSTTALSIGTTAQWWLSDAISLQGTAAAGLGYAAVGTAGSTAGERDYNYGVAPQALLALRFIHSDRAALDLSAREYFVSRVASGTSGGHDNIIRADASLTVRIARQQALTLRVLANRRNASFPGSGSSRQLQTTVGVFWTLLGQDRFGAVDWR